MARAATGGSGKWIVFWAATLALALSTLIAVLFGGALTRVVPERAIKLAAGALFVVFGVIILVNAVRPGAEAAAAPKAQTGLLARAVLRAAAEFEAAAAADYDALASRATDPALRALLESLAAGERAHLERVRHPDLAAAEAPLALAALPAKEELTHDAAAESRDIIAHAIEHEEATARFYEELARVSHLPSLKSAAAELAREERAHIAELEKMRGMETGV